VSDAAVDEELKNICLDIEQRYKLKFLEIGTAKDHVTITNAASKED
jgi:putative transposase